MKFGVPWSVKGIRPEARETAKEAARRSGMSLGDWLNSVIIQQAEHEGVQAHADEDDHHDDELANVNERLDHLSRRIEQLMRSGPAAYAPRRMRNESDQVADLIGRLDHRLDQFAGAARMAPPIAPPVMPPMQLPPSLDRAVAEIAARQRALKGEPPLAAPHAPPLAVAPPLTPMQPAMAAPVPLPAQNLSGLEQQLRNITDQIETLRKPGVEQAINALRDELAEIGHSLTEAMPRRAIDTIEKQIQGLTRRIAEGRQAGVDGGALAGIEHGLAEVRDALRGLTPAENLIGFNEAVAGLAHKIDLIVAKKDPETLAQLENAITTLRGMTGSIASNDAVTSLAAQVQALGEKVEQIARAAAGGDALGHLEQRISALSDALAERAQSGATVPPRLEALVESLSDKIEQIQNSRGDNVAFGHLEDRIVSLVEKLDASDSRLGHLEAIERGLAELLVNIEDIKANKSGGALRAGGTGGVDDLKQDIARTQDALEAVHGTLGIMVDRLAIIEKDIRSGGRTHGAADADPEAPAPPIGKLAVRMVSEAPPEPPRMPPAAPLEMPEPPPRSPQAALPPPPPQAPPPPPQRLPAAKLAPIDPDLPPDQPLEPGSGPPNFRANPAARIAASEAALGGAKPAAAAPGGKSGFIAAARRAANAAGQDPAPRVPRPEPLDLEPEGSGLRTKLMRRIKSLFIAASVIAAVIGAVQIGGTWLDYGRADKSRMAKVPHADAGGTDKTASAPPLSLAANPPEPAKEPAAAPPANPPTAPLPLDLDHASQGTPPLFSAPPPEQMGDVTGSISRAVGNSRPAAAEPPALAHPDLPAAIGSVRLRSAATAGDGAAAYEVALRFAEGRGVPVNMEEAAHWFERAASKGLAPAQFRFASLLEKGQGVKKDLARARRLYIAAAARGNAKAMHNLAVLYAEGIDGKPDYPAAAQWFRKAANEGISDSQYNLGILAARGLGIAMNMAESYKWFALAAAQGDKEAAKKRDEVAAHLDPETLAAAKQAAADFVAKRQPEDAVKVPAPAGGWDRTSETHSPKPKPRPAAPLALGSFTVGKQ